MIPLIQELFATLTNQQKKRLIRLQYLLIVSSIGETIGVSSIAPFMQLITDSSRPETNSFFSYLIKIPFAHEKNLIQFAGLIVLGVIFTSSVLSIIANKKIARFAADVGTENGDELFKFYLNQDWLFHTKSSSSYFVKQISSEATRVTDLVILPMVLLISKITLVTFLFIGLTLIEPIITFSGVLIFGIYYLLVFQKAKKKLNENGIALTQEAENRFKIMNEAFGGIRDVILYNKIDSYTKTFRTSGKSFAKARSENHILWQIPRYYLELLAFSSIIIILILASVNSESGINNLIPVLSLFLLASLKILPAIQQIYASIGQIKGNKAGFDSIKFDLKKSRKTKDEIFALEIKFPENDIKFKNVSFKYPNKSTNVLNSLSVNFPINKTIGIVGVSGGGKSTILDLLLGLIKPNSGEIYLDDRQLLDSHLSDWQRNIGYVPQNIFLTEGTISNNIAFTNDDESIDHQKVREVISQVELEDVIKQLPKGLDSTIGERGVQLSGGQRQRIGIARALYKNSKLLVLDEATSSLDGRTEKQIMDSIYKIKKDRTIIIVAHRIKTIINCDLILFIKEGRLFDKGTYEYLVSTNEEFRLLAKNS